MKAVKYIVSVSLALAPFAALLACSSSTNNGSAADDAGDQTQYPDAEVMDASTAKKDAGDAPSGPKVECAAGSAVEVEPNDTPETATPFTALMFCGVLSSGTDVDYSTFNTPTGMKLGLFQAVINGKVDFQLTVNGQSFGPTDTSQFTSGTYLVKASTSAGQPASYNYRIQFDPN